MRRTSRAALTLVEMLVAMAVTLIMMGAVVTMFGNVGNSISGSRGVMEISERLRNCRNVLQRDLSSVTATMLPPLRPENDPGYFEYVEGIQWDDDPIAPDTITPPKPAWFTLLGDADDTLRMTVRSRGEPFVGRYNGATITSQTAEVVWFAVESTTAPVLDVSALHTTAVPTPPALQGQPRRLKTLYRRVFLVVPSITTAPAADDDVSVSGNIAPWHANTLGDLTKRENRFASQSAFPFLIEPAVLVPLTGTRLGEDVVLTNVLAFDVKAYDPTVAVKLTSSNIAVLPSDAGYTAAPGTAGAGGYVDLYYDRYATPGAPWNTNFSSAGATTGLSGVYDTWSMHYEQNGFDENSDSYTDGGTNGLDDDNDGIVDDPGELDAPPPYSTPLRGIQVKIRVYEPDSRQVREVTVVQDFLPQ